MAPHPFFQSHSCTLSRCFQRRSKKIVQPKAKPKPKAKAKAKRKRTAPPSAQRKPRKRRAPAALSAAHSAAALGDATTGVILLAHTAQFVRSVDVLAAIALAAKELMVAVQVAPSPSLAPLRPLPTPSLPPDITPSPAPSLPRSRRGQELDAPHVFRMRHQLPNQLRAAVSASLDPAVPRAGRAEVTAPRLLAIMRRRCELCGQKFNGRKLVVRARARCCCPRPNPRSYADALPRSLAPPEPEPPPPLCPLPAPRLLGALSPCARLAPRARACTDTRTHTPRHVPPHAAGALDGIRT